MSKQDYLALVEKRKQEKAAKGETIVLEMPSGAKWTVLPLRFEQYSVSGRLPSNLIQKIQIKRGATVGDANISEAEAIQIGMAHLEMVREFLLNSVLEPRITLHETDDTITPEQIDPEDFDYISTWILNGGQAEAKLKSTPPANRKRKRAA